MRRELITVRWDCDYCSNCITVVVDHLDRHSLPDGWGKVAYENEHYNMRSYKDACPPCLKHRTAAGMDTTENRNRARGKT